MPVGLRAIIFAAIGIVSSWCVGANGMAFIFERSNPGLALSFVSNHGAALAQKADILFLTAQTEESSSERRDQKEKARKYAGMAIQRDATSAQAFRIIGTIEKGDDRKASAISYLRQAEKLSRREPGAQIYLAEYSFIDKNWEDGFRHLDVALRTSRAGKSILFPALHAAMKDDSMTDIIVDILSETPSWRADYIVYSLNQPTGSEDLAKILSKTSSFPAKNEESFIPFLVQQLIAEKKYLAAHEFFESRYPARAKKDQLVRDSRFVVAEPLPPVTWDLSNGVDGRADLLSESTGGIQISIDAGRKIVVARQFLFLAPGAYEMSSALANVDKGISLQWRVVCADAGTGPIGRLSLAGSGSERKYFEVPEDACRYQWAELEASSAISARGKNAEVMSFNIARRP